MDPDLGGEETTVQQQFKDKDEAETAAGMIIRQLHARPPAFQSTYDPDTGRIEYYRSI